MNPKEKWKQNIQNNLIDYDPLQEPVIDALDRLYNEIKDFKPAPSYRRFIPRFLKHHPQISYPKGLYIWGSVGRGKSMMMDLFAKQLASLGEHNVQRKHFHEFMQEIQNKLSSNLEQYRKYDNPFIPLARELSSKHKILCFDEFQVTNIADAMILGRLFQALFNHGVTVISTSNTAPNDLYKDGLQHALFAPFIDILKQHMHVIEIDGNQDYRLRDDILENAWLFPNNIENKEKLNELFVIQTSDYGQSSMLTIGSRSLPLIKMAGQVAMVEYATLCREPRGVDDYSALGDTFHSIYLMNVPSFEHEGSAVRRFINLIDILYEKRVRLHVLANNQAESLNPPESDREIFKRTLSRIGEICSQDWQANAYTAWKKKRSLSS